ncbi:heme NO-binding domain-containing protein [Amaricoccus sp.]|uniref:heme NO-binding domain-containing protein n=1 Tax=Amaricoccus sp. TaxID=1872485 RepID=UPI001B3F80D7|nr:heme NO-binding domain-containing protein [Amaricoccus sp.]MBP7242606.1 heme NO-binding domain-containing protein [Amaricoccus sp.]
MYGMIHQAARDLAVAHLGEAEWERLVETSGLNGRHFIGFEYYSDAETMRIVGLIADRLGCSMAETFYLFGRTWIDFAGTSAYGRVLCMAGGDLETFISNLDRMHASIKSNMPKASLPGFEVVESRDGAIHVLYRSEREGLAPFVHGILSAVAERFGERVTIDYEARPGGALFVLARQPVNA